MSGHNPDNRREAVAAKINNDRAQGRKSRTLKVKARGTQKGHKAPVDGA